jgi:hypothetical protein
VLENLRLFPARLSYPMQEPQMAGTGWLATKAIQLQHPLRDEKSAERGAQPAGSTGNSLWMSQLKDLRMPIKLIQAQQAQGTSLSQHNMQLPRTVRPCGFHCDGQRLTPETLKSSTASVWYGWNIKTARGQQRI